MHPFWVSFLYLHLIYILADAFKLPFQVPPLQTGPSRPSRAARRGVSTHGRRGRRAPAIQDDESSEKEESAHLQSETSAGRDDDSSSSFEGRGDAEEDSKDGDSDSDGGADDGGAEAAQPKRASRS